MKVYLVNPPAYKGIKMVREGRCMQRKGAWTTVWAPVTLATMAAMLKKDNAEVKLNDCIVEDISFDRLKSIIMEFGPDLVVINTATASIFSDLDCARISKEVSPEIKTLAFGLHVTALPEEAFLKEACLDYIIRGEPEFCLLELARALKSGEDISGIKGLSYRHNSSIRHNQDRGFDEDLNNLPFPAWELVDVNNYTLPLTGEPFLLITTSKGCPHACIFCPAKPFGGARLRLRNYQNAVDELAYVKERFKVSQFLIWSESFTEDRNYVVCFSNEIIRRKLEVGWVCNSRVDNVDLELLSIMKKAGCWMIGYGVESGVQEILDNAHKNISVEQIENAVSLAKRAGLEVTAHVIFGLPGETRETGTKTINWLKQLPIDFAQFYCAVPWPSAPLFNIAKEKNWLTTSKWEFYEQNYCIMDTGTIQPKQVQNLRRLAMRKFYFTFPKAWAILKKINSLKKAWHLIKTVSEFISWI